MKTRTPVEWENVPFDVERGAMIIYTSGTTGPPKGVVHTHAGLTHQIRTLCEQWEWTPSDHILQVLPLHHIHGIVNCVCCCLWAGANCEMMRKFEVDQVWNRFLDDCPLTLFMAVPTIYIKLIKAYEMMNVDLQKRVATAMRRLNFVISCLDVLLHFYVPICCLTVFVLHLLIIISFSQIEINGKRIIISSERHHAEMGEHLRASVAGKIRDVGNRNAYLKSHQWKTHCWDCRLATSWS
jgi:acyl-CoA synthetase (AMP-forming)/AMP-acid ligase II